MITFFHEQDHLEIHHGPCLFGKSHHLRLEAFDDVGMVLGHVEALVGIDGQVVQLGRGGLRRIGLANAQLPHGVAYGVWKLRR